VRSARPLESFSATCNPDYATIDVMECSLTCFLLSVRPNKGLPVGPFDFLVSISGALASGESIPPSQIRVFGRIHEEVQALPYSLHLGAARKGEKLRGTVTLLSRVNRPFQVESIVPHSGETLVEVHNANSNQVELRITQLASGSGDRVEDINMVVRSNGDAPFEIRLPVSYYGLEIE